MRCYFGENAKRKISISLYNFDGQLPYVYSHVFVFVLGLLGLLL